MPDFAVELQLPAAHPRAGYRLMGYSFEEAIRHAHHAAQKSRVRVSMSVLRDHMDGVER